MTLRWMISQNLVKFSVAHHGLGAPRYDSWGAERDQGDRARSRFRSRECAPGTWAAMKEDRGLFWSARTEKANVLWPVPRARLPAQSCRDDANQDGTGTYTAGSAWTVSRETGGLFHPAQGEGMSGSSWGQQGPSAFGGQAATRQCLGMGRDRSHHQGVQPGTTPRAGGSLRTDPSRNDWSRRERSPVG